MDGQRWTFSALGRETGLADGNLHVRALWPDGRRLRNESCSFEIAMPDVEGVTITTDNGTPITTTLDVDETDRTAPVERRAIERAMRLAIQASATPATTTMAGPGCTEARAW